jgi:hypothetical protein
VSQCGKGKYLFSNAFFDRNKLVLVRAVVELRAPAELVKHIEHAHQIGRCLNEKLVRSPQRADFSLKLEAGMRAKHLDGVGNEEAQNRVVNLIGDRDCTLSESCLDAGFPLSRLVLFCPQILKQPARVVRVHTCPFRTEIPCTADDRSGSLNMVREAQARKAPGPTLDTKASRVAHAP